MAEKNSRVGVILGLIGSTILMIVGLSGIALSRVISSVYPPDYPSFLVYITSGTTIAWSSIALYGIVKIYKDDENGKLYLLMAGIVGTIATFIPIYFYDIGYGYIQIFYLSTTFIYADLVLIIVGGILSYALADKKER